MNATIKLTKRCGIDVYVVLIGWDTEVSCFLSENAALAYALRKGYKV